MATVRYPLSIGGIAVIDSNFKIGQQLIGIKTVSPCDISQRFEEGLTADALTGDFIVFLENTFSLPESRYDIQNGSVRAEHKCINGHGSVRSFSVVFANRIIRSPYIQYALEVKFIL